MEARDLRQSGSVPRYTVSLSLTVEDATSLWAAAADRALRSPGMTLSDVLDTIGPREDPSIADCIAMLAGPTLLAGCTFQDFEVAASPERRAIELPIRVIAAPERPAAVPMPLQTVGWSTVAHG